MEITFDYVSLCGVAGREGLLCGVWVGAEDDWDGPGGDGVVVDVDADAGIDHRDPRARIPLEGWSAIDDVGRSRQSLQQELDTVFAVGVDCPSESDAFGLGQLGSLPQNLCEKWEIIASCIM